MSSFKANQQNSGLIEVIHPNKVPPAQVLHFVSPSFRGLIRKGYLLVDEKTHPNFEDLPQTPTSTGGATTANGTSTGSEGLKGG